MKMARRFGAAAIAAIAMTLGLSFGNARADEKIVFWNNWDGNRAPQLRSLLDEFEKRNPGIKVENVTLSNDTSSQRMLTAVASGAVPDLYMTQANDFARWASLGAFLPIDDFVKRDGVKLNELFFKSSIDGSTANGKLIQLPYKVATSLMIWYNKKLFAAAGLDPNNPPRTWEELEAAAKKLTVANGNVITQLGLNICTQCTTGGENSFIEWISRNGGSILTPDGKGVAFESEAGIETLKWMVGFSDRTAGGWSNVVRQFGSSYKELRPNFYAGKLAMIQDGPFLYNIMATDAPQMLEQVGAFVAPVNGKNPNAKQRYLGYGVPGYAIPKASKNPEAAWKLLKFIAADEAGACKFFEMQKRADTPLRICKPDVPPAFAAVFKENAEIVDSPVSSSVFPQINVRIQQMQEAALLGKQQPEQAVKAAAEDIRQLLSRATN